MSNNHYNKKLCKNANHLRHNMTKAEACLWKYVLSAGKMLGYQFRRQRPIGWYIADFACFPLKLLIEVDGASHLFEETQIKDIEKEYYLLEQGYKVIHFTDEEVLNNITDVKLRIEMEIKLIEDLNPPSTPSRGGYCIDSNP